MRGNSTLISWRCPRHAAAGSSLHRPDARTELPGRVDLSRAHPTRRAGRPAHVPQLKSAPPSARTISDAYLTDTIREAEELYGRRKMYLHLFKKGQSDAAWTVDLLMGDEGKSGVVRGKRHRIVIRVARTPRTFTYSTVTSHPRARIKDG